MKVLYITTMYPVPAYPQQGIFCHEQVKALMRAGVEVTVAVPIPFYDRQKENQWDYEGVHIRYIRFFKLPGARDFHRTGKALFARLKKQLDLSKFDIYHADAPLPSGYAVMLAAEKYKKPFIVHGHGLDVFLDGSYAGLKNCQKIADACQLVYEKADAVVGVSQKVLDKIRQRVDISGKSFVAYNGVDTDKFCPVEKKTSDKVNITAIGNLIRLKGHDYTLRAIKVLVDKGYENIRLKLIGRGPLEQELKDLAKELDIEQYVDFVGYIPYEDVAKQLQNSDIFVLPSWYEALGCVYLEAMACGVPAIGCRNNGIDEVIEHKKTGCLADNQSLEQLVDCLEYLLDEENRRSAGKAAREAVVQQYTWTDSGKTLLSAYDFVICKR